MAVSIKTFRLLHRRRHANAKPGQGSALAAMHACRHTASEHVVVRSTLKGDK